MLRRIEGMDALGLGRMDWDRAAALARRALWWTALAGTMFLLCRARALSACAPFAMAFLAAALLAGKSPSALLAGCVAGAVNGAIQDFDLRLPMGAAIVLGGNLLWDQLGPGLSAALRGVRSRMGREPRIARAAAPGGRARAPTQSAPALGPALAGTGVLLPGLMFAGERLWPTAVQVAAASVAAVAAAPFFASALELSPRRRWLDPEERAGVLLLLGAMAAGLARLYMPLALCACGTLALLLYPCGALAGVGFGAALLMAGNAEPRLWALAAASGAAAQLGASLTRQGRAVGACGATVTAGLLLNVPPVMLAGAGLSALAALAMPEAWAEAVSRLAKPTPEADDPMRLADQARRESAARLRALGAAFGELAEGYLEPVALPDEQTLMNRLRERLCDGCAGYAACWTGGRDGGARLLCELIAGAVTSAGEAPLFEEEATPDLLRRCRRGRLIPERLQEPLEDFARARRSELKRGAENRLISAQFSQARQLLDGLAERQEAPIRLRAGQALRAAAALERAGVAAGSVLAVGGPGAQIVAGLREGRWTPELARAASAGLSAALGGVYAPAGLPGRALRFKRRPRLGVASGVVCVSRQAGVPSGDSHLVCMLDDERLLALICDGMGSGEEAARESGLAVRLLGRFLRSGARTALAVETVNALLLNRGGEDMFATVDMLILNLSSGEAVFTKLAACPTLIARDGAVRRVEGGRLPLGILERVQPRACRVKLMPGDVLLMGSDGVMDAAGSAALEALMLEEGDMRALAHRVQAEAEAVCGEGRRDDMTAICLRVKGF